MTTPPSHRAASLPLPGSAVRPWRGVIPWRAWLRQAGFVAGLAGLNLLVAWLVDRLFVAAFAVLLHAPGPRDLLHVLGLGDYNTLVVVSGACLLGAVCGVVGSFMLLRRRALVGDALAHAMLPGIALAFMIMAVLGGTGKNLPLLLLGGLGTGLLGVAGILVIRRFSRIKEDAALGIVLSVFFAAGIVLLSLIQKMKQGSAAGLESFIYGKTASMLASDARLIAAVAGAALFSVLVLFKEFRLVCFDQQFAGALGWPVSLLDALMMAMAVGVTVVGLQAVGLILIVALLIVPPAAARFWTDRLGAMLAIAAAIGAASGLLGSVLSARFPDLPAGAVIVLVATGCFLTSLLLGSARGVLRRVVEHLRLQAKVGRQNLLRAIYERIEPHLDRSAGDAVAKAAGLEVPVRDLLAARSWSPRQLARLLRHAARRGLLIPVDSDGIRLTEQGVAAARRVVRNHRLWEMYLLAEAQVAPALVDRDADAVEHVLDEAMVAKLEARLLAEHPGLSLPASPHVLAVAPDMSRSSPPA